MISAFYIPIFVLFLPVVILILRIIQITIRYNYHYFRLLHLPITHFSTKYKVWWPYWKIMTDDREVTMNWHIDETGQSYKFSSWGFGFDGSLMLCVCDVSLVKQILLDHTSFPKHDAGIRWLRFLLGGDGVGSLSGFNERKVHRKAVLEVLNARSIMHSTELFKGAIENFCVKGLYELNGEEEVYTYEYFKLKTMYILIRVIFDDMLDADLMSELWYKVAKLTLVTIMGTEFLGYFYNLLPFGPAKELKYLRNQIKTHVTTAVKNRRKYMDENDVSGDDLISVLIDYVDPRSGSKFTDSEIVLECMTMLLTGSSTISGLLTWASYYIGRSDEVQQNIFDEVNSICGDEEITMKHVRQFEYTRAVMKEVLRLKPAAPFLDRIAAKTTNLGDYKIPKGTRLMLFFTPMMKDVRYWDQPQEFIPERFFEERPEIYSYMPFSVGVMNCIGQKYAIWEAMLIFSTLVRKFRIQSIMEEKEFELLEGRQTPKNLKFKFIPRK
eukprot:TRINITY_DN8318_c0_g1_i1.p1 TRINITY_DN8318_c0_g1~~TRINITY_DN8318_c0_g1_i1.p1  ORF type:complete len:496 (+),score=85.03 TRINITY_DN8318_c0_g1_i1:278-1765(+)